jgi:elongation factor P hydroxylase
MGEEQLYDFNGNVIVRGTAVTLSPIGLEIDDLVTLFNYCDEHGINITATHGADDDIYIETDSSLPEDLEGIPGYWHRSRFLATFDYLAGKSEEEIALLTMGYRRG